MTIRSEIESKLAGFANTQIPPIPVALENRKFTKPTTGYYFEVVLLDSLPMNANLGALSTRLWGKFQINLYGPLGGGTGEIETLAHQVVNLYPVIPKIGIVSIEKPLNAGQGIVVDNFYCVPITGSYRVEQ